MADDAPWWTHTPWTDWQALDAPTTAALARDTSQTLDGMQETLGDLERRRLLELGKDDIGRLHVRVRAHGDAAREAIGPKVDPYSEQPAEEPSPEQARMMAVWKRF